MTINCHTLDLQKMIGMVGKINLKIWIATQSVALLAMTKSENYGFKFNCKENSKHSFEKLNTLRLRRRI